MEHGLLDRVNLDPTAPWGRVHMWVDGHMLSVAIQAPMQHGWRIEADGKVCDVQVAGVADGVWQGVAGQSPWAAGRRGALWEVQLDGDRFTLLPAYARSFDKEAVAGAAVAPLSGTVSVVSVSVGDRVEAGDVLAIIEAMKMEHSVLAGFAGTVRSVAFAVGDSVKEGELIVDVEAEELQPA